MHPAFRATLTTGLRLASCLALLLGLGLGLGPGGARAQVAPPAGAPLPLVDAQGGMSRHLRLSEALAALGPPDRQQLHPALRENGRVSQPRRSLYWDATGLQLLVNDDLRASDPAVLLVSVSAPSTALTPQGLGIGASEAEALPIIRNTYRTVHEFDYGTRQHSLRLATKKGPGELSVTFENGRLTHLSFNTEPPPSLLETWRPILGPLFILALVIGGGMLATKLGWRPGDRAEDEDERDPDAPTPVVHALAVVGAVATIGLGLLAASLWRGGDAERMVALFAGLGALSLGFWTLVLLGRSSVPALRVLSWVAVALVVLASVAGKLLH